MSLLINWGIIMTFRQRLACRKERGYTQKDCTERATERCILVMKMRRAILITYGLIAPADYFNVPWTIWSGRSDRRERNP